jgi:hypothetical protein
VPVAVSNPTLWWTILLGQLWLLHPDTMVLNPRLYYHILNVHGFVLTQQNAHFIQK